MSRPVTIAVLCLFSISAAYFNWIWPQLPPVIVTQFNLSGDPVSEMNRLTFALVFWGAMIFAQGLVIILSIYIRKINMRFINIPWKSYWLSNDMLTKEAAQKVTESLGLVLAFMGIMQLFVVHIIAQENIPSITLRIPITETTLAIVALSIALTVWWIVQFKPKK